MSDSNFSKEFYDRWNHLLSDIDMDQVPLRFVEKISVNLENNETVDFNISNLFNEKVPVRQIEKKIQKFLDKHQDRVDGVDFHLNVKAVADTVTKKVSKILDND